jgi:transcriptional regulator with XRE-family HTH domain
MSTPPESWTSPIAELRHVIGLSQPKFARLLGVSFDTVASLEVGRARVTPFILEKVQFATGAVWDEKNQLWRLDPWVRHFLKEEIGARYTSEIYERFRDLSPVSPIHHKAASTAMVNTLRDLCQAMPLERYVELVQKFGRFLDECQPMLRREAKLDKGTNAEALDRGEPSPLEDDPTSPNRR